MAADMDICCIKQLFFYFFIRICCRLCCKYFFKSTCPCLFCLFQTDRYIPICQHCFLSYCSDLCIAGHKVLHFSRRYLCNEITKCRCEQILFVHRCLKLNSQSVTKCHLTYSTGNSMTIKCISGNDSSFLNIFMDLSILLHHFLINRKIIFISLNLKPYKLISCFFQFRCDDILLQCHIDCKRYQRRRNINILECSGHTVLTSDWRKTKSDLCRIGSEQCSKRLAPSLRIFGHSAEILLECKTDLTIISTGCHDLCNRFCHRINCSVIRTPAWQIRIKSITHHGYAVRCTILYRNFCHHRLRLCHLIFSAMRHEHWSGSDGTVKHFHKTLLRAYI